MKRFKMGMGIAAVVLGMAAQAAQAGFWTSRGTYIVTHGDTVESVVRDTNVRSADELILLTSPGRNYLQGKTLQRILDEGHILWANDEYAPAR